MNVPRYVWVSGVIFVHTMALIKLIETVSNIYFEMKDMDKDDDMPEAPSAPRNQGSDSVKHLYI